MILLFAQKYPHMDSSTKLVGKLLEKLSSNDFDPEDNAIAIADAIAEFNDPDTISQLIAIIKKQDNFYDSLLPARALGMMKDAAIDPIRELLHDNNPICKASGIFALGFLQDEQFSPYLLDALNDPHEDVRRSAAGVLALYGVRIIPLLKKHLLDADSETRVSIIEILGKVKDRESAKLLFHLFLTDENSEVSREALDHFLFLNEHASSELSRFIDYLPRNKLALIVRDLGCVPEGWAIDTLFDVLTRFKESGLQNGALLSIGNIGLPALDIMKEHLRSDDENVKICAIKALGEIGDTVSSFLESDLDDEDLEEHGDDYLEMQRKVLPVIDSLIQLTRDSNTTVSKIARNSLTKYEPFYDDETHHKILISQNESDFIRETTVEQYIEDNKIPDNVFKLLWFRDGKYKSKVPQAEPSLIYSQYKIITHPKIDPLERLDYFPTFRKLNPQQRYVYLNWLRDITQPVALGYVFIFYYGLERHLLLGNYERAVDTILQLLPHFDSVKRDTIIIALLAAAYYQNDTLIGTKIKKSLHQFHPKFLQEKSIFEYNLFYNWSIPDRYRSPAFNKKTSIEDLILFFYETLKTSGCLPDSFDEWIVHDKIIMTDPSKKDQKLELLIQKLADRNFSVRRRAAYDLSKVESPKKIEPLIQCLSDSNGSVREAAIQSLLMVKKGQSVEPLIVEPIYDKLFDRAKNVRCAAVHYLGMSDDPKAIEALKSALSQEDLRHEAARALGKKGISNPLIIQVLEEDSRDKWADGQDARDTLGRLSVVNAIRDALWEVETVDAAIIYGSFVSTYFDFSYQIDLLVVGGSDLKSINNAVANAENIIEKSINCIIYSKDEFKQKISDRDPSIETFLNAPKMVVIGDFSDLRV